MPVFIAIAICIKLNDEVTYFIFEKWLGYVAGTFMLKLKSIYRTIQPLLTEPHEF